MMNNTADNEWYNQEKLDKNTTFPDQVYGDSLLDEHLSGKNDSFYRCLDQCTVGSFGSNSQPSAQEKTEKASPVQKRKRPTDDTFFDREPERVKRPRATIVDHPNLKPRVSKARGSQAKRSARETALRREAKKAKKARLATNGLSGQRSKEAKESEFIFSNRVASTLKEAVKVGRPVVEMRTLSCYIKSLTEDPALPNHNEEEKRSGPRIDEFLDQSLEVKEENQTAISRKRSADFGEDEPPNKRQKRENQHTTESSPFRIEIEEEEEEEPCPATDTLPQTPDVKAEDGSISRKCPADCDESESPSKPKRQEMTISYSEQQFYANLDLANEGVENPPMTIGALFHQKRRIWDTKRLGS